MFLMVGLVILVIVLSVHIGFRPPNSPGKCRNGFGEKFISTARERMAGRDLDRTFAPRKLLPNATSSSSSGTQCRGGADSARQALCGCRSTSLHMLHGSCVLQNAEQRNGDRFRECARSRVRIGLGGVTLSAELQGGD